MGSARHRLLAVAGAAAAVAILDPGCTDSCFDPAKYGPLPTTAIRPMHSLNMHVPGAPGG